MKIPFLSKLFQSRAGPKNSLWTSTYSFFFGSTTSGKAVNERTAMQTTAVYACVRILAETIASLPLHLYKYTESGKKKALEHSLYYMLHDEPNPEMTSFVFRETLMSHLLLWGNLRTDHKRWQRECPGPLSSTPGQDDGGPHFHRGALLPIPKRYRHSSPKK